ncbi:hypothetical protein SAMN05444285_13757, partial [Draconibacterium orientale]
YIHKYQQLIKTDNGKLLKLLEFRDKIFRTLMICNPYLSQQLRVCSFQFFQIAHRLQIGANGDTINKIMKVLFFDMVVFSAVIEQFISSAFSILV